MSYVSVRIGDDLERELIAIARKRGTSKAEIIREALRVYLTSADDAEPGSCFDLARDLFGCFEGPSDLSYNKEYMKDFGK